MEELEIVLFGGDIGLSNTIEYLSIYNKCKVVGWSLESLNPTDIQLMLYKNSNDFPLSDSNLPTLDNSNYNSGWVKWSVELDLYDMVKIDVVSSSDTVDKVLLKLKIEKI